MYSFVRSDFCFFCFDTYSILLQNCIVSHSNCKSEWTTKHTEKRLPPPGKTHIFALTFEVNVNRGFNNNGLPYKWCSTSQHLTHALCLPRFLSKFSLHLEKNSVHMVDLSLVSGNIELLYANIARKRLIVNLGSTTQLSAAWFGTIWIPMM